MALQFLFQEDLNKEKALVDQFLNHQIKHLDIKEAHQQEVIVFAKALITGVQDSLTELDDAINAVADNWSLNRMAVTDRCTLRLGCYELLHREDIPAAVTINEALELAHLFGGKESASFINGILDRILNAQGSDH